jgi:putative membrane protein
LSKNIFATLLKKELFMLVHSFAFWFSFIFFHLALSFLFLGMPVWFDMQLSSFSYFFSLFPFVFIVVIPMLTIGSWSDEYKTQTCRLLFLFPVSEAELVFAKFVSCSVAFFIQLAVSILIPISVSSLVFFEPASFIFSYISLFTFGISCIAISLALSSLSSESAVSFALSFLTIAFFSLVHFVVRILKVPKFIEVIIETISFSTHFQNASLGILNIGDYIFYAALILLGITMNIFILKLRRIKNK